MHCTADRANILYGQDIQIESGWGSGWPIMGIISYGPVVVCIVGGQRLTKGQDASMPPALATWGNVGKRAGE